MKLGRIISIILGILLLAVALPVNAQTPVPASSPACANLSEARLKMLKGVKHGTWTLSELTDPENRHPGKTLLAKYRSHQECERAADELRADLCVGFICEDRYGCQLFQPFHPCDSFEIAEGRKATEAAHQLGKKLRGKVPGLESVCAGLSEDGLGITEVQVFVRQRTSAVQALVPKTFGGFPVDIWPDGEARFD